MHTATEILRILDACAERYTFPMLDNGYVYLAATRLSAFRSETDWALVIEVFGYSPREGLPSLATYTFASTPAARPAPSAYVTSEAHRQYLATNPHNEFQGFNVIGDGPWLDAEDSERVTEDLTAELEVRGKRRMLPSVEEYARAGIELAEAPRVRVCELCRYLAAVARDEVLATTEERRAHVGADLAQLLVLDEWHHPDLVNQERPSAVASFQQLAEVLATGDVAHYQPTRAPNTHWRHWPDGGSL